MEISTTFDILIISGISNPLPNHVLKCIYKSWWNELWINPVMRGRTRDTKIQMKLDVNAHFGDFDSSRHLKTWESLSFSCFARKHAHFWESHLVYMYDYNYLTSFSSWTLLYCKLSLFLINESDREVILRHCDLSVTRF